MGNESLKSSATASKQLRVPPADPYFFLPKGVVSNIERLQKLSKKHPVNVLVTGKQGCGKSSLVRQVAARFDRPLTTFQMGLLSEPGQLFGEQRLKQGETFYQEFLFPKAITTPRSIIHLEEINRPEHPKALNELYSVLSEDRCIWVDELGMVEVSPEVMFFASINEGPEFAGVDALDAALRDRFYPIRMDYLPQSVEEQVLALKAGVSEEDAHNIMNIIYSLRCNPQQAITVSTRHSLMVAELMSAGAGIKEAFIYSMDVSKDVLESCLLSLHLQRDDAEVDSEEYELF